MNKKSSLQLFDKEISNPFHTHKTHIEFQNLTCKQVKIMLKLTHMKMQYKLQKYKRIGEQK